MPTTSRNNLAMALMGIGQHLPSMIRSNRDYQRERELDPLRRMILESQAKGADLNNEKTAQDIEQGKADYENKQNAQSALSEAVDAFGRQKGYIKHAEETGNFAPLMEDPRENPKTLRDIALESDLPKYAGDPNVKQFMSDFVAAPEKSNDPYKAAQIESMKQRAAYLEQQMQNARTPEERLKLQKELEAVKHGNRMGEMAYGSDLNVKEAGEKRKATDKAGIETEAMNLQKALEGYKQIASYVTPAGLSGGAFNTALAKAKGLINSDDPINSLDDYNGFMSSIVARRIAQEKGALAEGDVRRSGKLLLSQYDTPSQRQIKLSALNNLSDPNAKFDDIIASFEKDLKSAYGNKPNQKATIPEQAGKEQPTKASSYLDEIRARRKALNK